MSESDRTEALASQLYDVAQKICEGAYGGAQTREGEIRISYRKVEASDPWIANLYGHHGTGQTIEMALLQLRAKLFEHLDAIAESDKKRLVEIQERIDFMNKARNG